MTDVGPPIVTHSTAAAETMRVAANPRRGAEIMIAAPAG